MATIIYWLYNGAWKSPGVPDISAGGSTGLGFGNAFGNTYGD